MPASFPLGRCQHCRYCVEIAQHRECHFLPPVPFASFDPNREYWAYTEARPVVSPLDWCHYYDGPNKLREPDITSLTRVIDDEPIR